MKTSVPIPSSMTRPRAKIKTGPGLPCKTVVVQCNNKAVQKRGSPGGMPGPTTAKWRDYDIRLFERLRYHRLLVMPEASSKPDRRHRDDDGQSEKCSHC